MEGQQHIQIDVNQLAHTLRRKLLHESPWPAECSIFKVPSTLRRYNQIVYTPKLVSIGPFHHGNENLQAMEKIKLWYLNCLLARAQDTQARLESFVEFIRRNVQQCRECYAEEVNRSTDEFVEMMVLDGCFIIELFRKEAKIVTPHVNDDPVFKTSWMRKTLLTDLLLLENQLPWFVLEHLFNLSNPDLNPQKKLSLAQLAIEFFSFNTLRIDEIKPNHSFQNKHLLDFQRNNLLSSFANNEPEHIPSWHIIPSVTELLQAGIRFEKGEATEIMKIEFNNGVMTIPPIMFLDNAETFIRNLIAYEQCDCRCKDKITSYAILWDNLINSSKDLDYLSQKKIITCYLSTEDLSSSFKRFYNDADVVYYTYAKLSQKIIAHCQARCPRWRVMLLRDYFGNPWSIMSFSAAVLVLILALTNTLYAIVYHKPTKGL